MDIPLHWNIGDSLITLGELRLLSSMQIRPPLHFGSRTDPAEDTLSRIQSGANVLMHGGGNLGDLWPDAQEYRLRMTRLAAGRATVIWMPQSVYFRDVKSDLVRRTREVLQAFRPRVLLRDAASMRVWNSLFDAEAFLCPDLGLVAPVERLRNERSGVIHLFRKDQEAVSHESHQLSVDWEDVPSQGAIRDALSMVSRKIAASSPTSVLRKSPLERLAFEHLAQHKVRAGIQLISAGETLETDRLHASILGLLLGLSVVARDNMYGKLGAVFSTWSDFIDPTALTYSRDWHR